MTWFLWILACAKHSEPLWDTPDNEASVLDADREMGAPSLGEPITAQSWADAESALTVRIPEGWRGWPGIPGARIRLHLNHPLSGTEVRVFSSSNSVGWPTSLGCKWTFSDAGSYAVFSEQRAVEYASCWPTVPGASSKVAWRFPEQDTFWLIEAQLVGGKVGLAHESLDALLPSMQFRAP